MSMPVFHSYKPYLQIGFREAELFITFSADCTYTPHNELELQILRKYAEDTKASFILSESVPLEDLQRGHEAFEDCLVQEAEARLEAQAAAERKRKAEHDFYSTLRAADKSYR